MNDNLVLYLIFVVVLVVLAAVAGRFVRRQREQRATGAPSAARPPGWVSRQPEQLEAGVEYCEVRADFNYIDEKPATSRVTITYFSRDESRREVVSERMTEREFNQQRANLRGEGWAEVYKAVDREGESCYFRRA